MTWRELRGGGDSGIRMNRIEEQEQRDDKKCCFEHFVDKEMWCSENTSRSTRVYAKDDCDVKIWLGKSGYGIMSLGGVLPLESGVGGY